MKQAQQYVQGADNSTLGSAALQQASSACWQYEEEEVLLRSHMKPAGNRRRKQRKKAFAGFELSDVNQQIIEFLSPNGGSSNSLELPDFTKMQRMQVSCDVDHRVTTVVMPVTRYTPRTALSAGTRILLLHTLCECITQLKVFRECVTPSLAWSIGVSCSTLEYINMSLTQVRALAAVYGLEARACGRVGQTLFRSSHAGLPSADGRAQVRSLRPVDLIGHRAETASLIAGASPDVGGPPKTPR